MNLEELKEYSQEALKRGDFQTALKYINSVIEQESDDYVHYATRAGLYNCLRKFDLAILDTQKSISMNRNFSKSYIQQGFAQFNLKLYKEAIESYKIAISLDNENALVKDLLKKAIEKEKNQDEIYSDGKFLQGVITKLATHPKFSSYLIDKKFMNSLEILSKSPQLKDILQKQDPRIKQALDYLLDGSDEANLRDKNIFGQKADKTFYQCWANQAQTSNNKEGQEKQESTNEQSSDNQQQNNNEEQKENKTKENQADDKKIEGNNFFNEKQFDQALKCYQEAINLIPEEIVYRSNKIACLTELNQYKEAQKELDLVFKMIEESQDAKKDQIKISRIFQRQAVLFQKQNQLDKALDCYNISLKICKNKTFEEELIKLEELIQNQKKFQENPALKEAEDHRKLGQQLFNVGKFNDSIEEYGFAIEQNKNDFESYIGLSNCNVKLRNLPKALQCIDESLKINNQNIQAWIKKGQLHFFLQEYEHSQATFELASELDNKNDECKQWLQKSKRVIQSKKNDNLNIKVQEAMQNEELKQILQDEDVRNMLEFLLSNPQELDKIMNSNIYLKSKIELLIQHGLLKV